MKKYPKINTVSGPDPIVKDYPIDIFRGEHDDGFTTKSWLIMMNKCYGYNWPVPGEKRERKKYDRWYPKTKGAKKILAAIKEKYGNKF